MSEPILNGAISTIGATGLIAVYFIGTYNAGYFAALGVEYLHFFSISDIVITALFLMPVAVLTAFLSVASLVLYRWLIVRSILNENMAVLSAATLFCLLGFAIVLPTETRSMRIVAYTGGIIYFIAAVAFYRLIFSKISRGLNFSISFIGLSIVLILYGVYMLNMDMAYRKPSRVVILGEGASFEAQIIRASSNGILARNCDSGVMSFTTWAVIEKVERSDNCALEIDTTIPFTLKYLYF